MAEALARFRTLTIFVDFDPEGVPSDLDERPCQPRKSPDPEQ
jgi:hypothetical protein